VKRRASADLDTLQEEAAAMSDAQLQKARADLLREIRIAQRSTTLRYDKEQYENLQTLEVCLHVIKTEITIRSEASYERSSVPDSTNPSKPGKM
jgi:hypothetical protein